MSRVSLKAVLIGNLLDLAVSFITAIVLGIYVGFQIHRPHMSHIERHQAILSVIRSPAVRTITALLGMSISTWTGYVTGRIAKHDNGLNGLLSTALLVCYDMWAILLGKGFDPVWLEWLLLVTVAVFAFLGGAISRRTTAETPATDAHSFR